MQTFCRYAPSLGELEGTPLEAWSTPLYDPKKHKKEPTVFFGMFDFRDYIALAQHRGKVWVLWAGSDIRNLLRGFTFNDGKLKYLSRFGGNWWVYNILSKAEHWVENHVCRDALRAVGIEAHIGQSFMGNVNDFQVSYKHSEAPRVYICSPEGRQEEYGFDVVERIAGQTPDFTYHLYGAEWNTKHENVFVRGRVPKEQMNSEIKDMQIALRLNVFDGFSELLAKGILMGHGVVSRIEYPFIPRAENDNEIISLLESQRDYIKPARREHYLKNINNFPWAIRI